MNDSHLNVLACPRCKDRLTMDVNVQDGEQVLSGKLSCTKCKMSFEISEGIPDFTYPEQLRASDKEFNEKYQDNAAEYDIGMDWLFGSFFETEENVRTKLVDFLKIEPNHFILNMGCGSGSDSAFMLRKLGKEGVLFNLDLSVNLLKIARKKLPTDQSSLAFFVGNGSYLPFADNTFDSLFHFGGINIFSEKKKSISEMDRVVKPGGRIVFGDESVAPWLSKKLYGKIIVNANPLYKHEPPLDLLPENARDVSLNYLLGNAFYVIAYTKGEAVALNLDLPIPGKRGGTLRSRYEQKLNSQKS
jgi:ubiquinone/menaquinone biosynthesis C-methylase UbiE